MRPKPLLVGAVMTGALMAWAAGLVAAGPRMVKVKVEFRQSGTSSRQAIQGKGTIVITDERGVQTSGDFRADSRQTRVQQSTGIFTLVPDGGESTLTVATQVPYPEVAYYWDYATGAGYVAQGVRFRDVGTALRVRARVLPGNRVRVRLTPTISHFSPDGSGTIELTEATTELVVSSGRPVMIGGATTGLHEVTRQILGVSQRQSDQETTVVLTATVQ